jgi:hypothetical protein
MTSPVSFFFPDQQTPPLINVLWQLFRTSTPTFEEYPRLPVFPPFNADDYVSRTPIVADTARTLPSAGSAPVAVKLSGASLLNEWIIVKKAQVITAARIPLPRNLDAFDLDAPNGHQAGVALIASLRLVLRQGPPPASLEYFSGRLPRDVSDYLHISATYQMYVIICFNSALHFF